MSTPSLRAMDERTGSCVELLALDFAGLDHIPGQRRETRLIAQRHAPRRPDGPSRVPGRG